MIGSKGLEFRQLVKSEAPLPVLGTINAYSALLATESGAKAIYLSGAGVANASFGLPDLGMTGIADVAEDIRRITSVCDTPLLVDADTGWGHQFNIARTVREFESAGAAALHIEDQILAKRCGHRPNKAIVSQEEMCDRIKAAVDARRDGDFVIMARTDAYAVDGLEAAITRAQAFVDVGADMIFAEAMNDLSQYQQFTQAVDVPVLANITEFGKTPLYTRDELRDVGIQLVLYPLSAFRAMSHAAKTVYQAILESGSQKSVVDSMQTRDSLYQTLKYHEYEKQLDNER